MGEKVPERRLQDVFFYNLEAAIKNYRQFAQARVTGHGIDITVDQWLLLRTLQESPNATQQQLAASVFKDFASVTRIIQLLESKGYVCRKQHPHDGRRSALTLTREGRAVIRKLAPIIRTNRRAALRGVTAAEITRARMVLSAITSNCHRSEV